METIPRIGPKLVEEFVSKAHGDLSRVQELLDEEPALADYLNTL